MLSCIATSTHQYAILNICTTTKIHNEKNYPQYVLIHMLLFN